MGSQQKQTQMERKALYGKKLEKRVAYLTTNGVESSRIDKDCFVKKLRADIRAVEYRLSVIAAKEKKKEQPRTTAEAAPAAAAPKKEKESSKKPAKEKAAEGEKLKEAAKPKKEKVKKEPAKKEPEPAS